MINSALLIELKISLTKNQLIEIVHEGIRRSPHNELYIKLILTGGESPDGITPQDGNSNFIAIFQKAKSYPESMFTEGASLMTYPFQRHIPESKSLNYFAAVVSLSKARKEFGASEVLYIDPTSGHILEGTTVNFWIVLKGKVHTPNKNILFGCTRSFILNLCKKIGVEVVEAPIHCRYLLELEEAFVSSTTKEVMPITLIDGNPVGNGKIGPITKKIMNAFREYIQMNYYGQSSKL